MDFKEKVWKLLRKIPRGKVTTYGKIARALKNPAASRAVGNACGLNPRAPKVPCHRVVASDGRLGGYSGGIKKKIRLLAGEGVRVRSGKIEGFGEKLFRF